MDKILAEVDIEVDAETLAQIKSGDYEVTVELSGVEETVV